MDNGEVVAERKKGTQLCVLGDADSLIVNVNCVKPVQKLSKRRLLDVQDLRECAELGEIRYLKAINGQSNPLDCVTKPSHKCVKTRAVLVELLRTGVYKPDLQEKYIDS